MMINPISRLTANNAAFNMMNDANSIINLCSFKGDPAAAFAMEQRLTQDMLRNQLQYQASLEMEETQDRLNKENIKRTFSIFA